MFDGDLVIFAGFLIAALAIPSGIAALRDGRPPRTAALLVILGGGLVVYVLWSNPGVYTASELPKVFSRVLARLR